MHPVETNRKVYTLGILASLCAEFPVFKYPSPIANYPLFE